MGVDKTKFINYDLRYTENETALVPIRAYIKMPLLTYKATLSSPVRSKSSSKMELVPAPPSKIANPPK
jgi:hypothetical protein